MRLSRIAFTAATVVATLAGLSGTAAAAPPVGCYGFPDFPSAFVCVTSFTPENVVPAVGPSGGYTVTIPRFCAGDCYGPISYTVPGVSVTPGSGQVAVIVYNGNTYVVGTGLQPPPIPPIPPLPPIPPIPPLPSGSCPGDPILYAETEPYVCFHQGYDYYGYYDTWYIGTCVTGTCTVVEVPIGRLAERLGELINDDPVGTVGEYLCRRLGCSAG